MIQDLITDIKQQPNPLVSWDQFDELSAFLSESYQSQKAKYATISLPIEAMDPLACLELLWEHGQHHFYWENPANDVAIAAGRQLRELSASGKDRFEQISQSFKQIKQQTAEFSPVTHSYSGLILSGGFSFFDEDSDGLWEEFKSASFSVPEWLLLKEGKFGLLTLTVKLSDFETSERLLLYVFSQLRRFSTTLDVDSNATLHQEETSNNGFKQYENLLNKSSVYDSWISSVRNAKKLIKQYKFEKIVLARELSIATKENPSPTQIINILRKQYTNCYSFLIHRPNGDTFLGCTPERLISFHKNYVLTEALAGSMQRGKTATEDTILEKSLSGSRKNRDEHNFVIKDIEERLAPFVESIERDSRPEIKKLSNVQHLYTPITARLKRNVDPLSLVGKLHPTPAVGGYPWLEAKPYVKKLETFERGWYAGPVGWLTSKGGGEFAVAIRSGLLKGDKAHFFAGCGIVEDSDPDTEWEETNLKLMPMLSALQYD